MEGRLVLCWFLVAVEIQGSIQANWSPWEPCNLACGKGTQMRTKPCQTDQDCPNTGLIETRSCNSNPCTTVIRDTGRARKGLLGVSEKHHILRNHVIKQLKTNSVIECALHCLRHSNCLSLNVQGTATDGAQQWRGSLKVECQLNNGNQHTFPTDYVFYKGYTYVNLISNSSLLP